MAKRFFGVAVLVILALSTFGLWVTEGDHGRETGAGTAYLIAVGVSLLIVSVGGVAFTLARRVRAPRGAETGASGSESLGERHRTAGSVGAAGRRPPGGEAAGRRAHA
jgi:hypothetical protein